MGRTFLAMIGNEGWDPGVSESKTGMGHMMARGGPPHIQTRWERALWCVWQRWGIVGEARP